MKRYIVNIVYGHEVWNWIPKNMEFNDMASALERKSELFAGTIKEKRFYNVYVIDRLYEKRIDDNSTDTDIITNALKYPELIENMRQLKRYSPESWEFTL